eukprot:1151996-Pelagomonas_calceolata.AAC.3
MLGDSQRAQKKNPTVSTDTYSKSQQLRPWKEEAQNSTPASLPPPRTPTTLLPRGPACTVCT